MKSRRAHLRSLFQLALALGGLDARGNSSEQPRKTRVLLKLDDFTVPHNEDIAQAWIETLSFLADNSIPASVGILGNSSNLSSAKFKRLIQRIHQSSNIEIWNHGYASKYGSRGTHKFSETEEEQKQKIELVQHLLHELTGKLPSFFGPHSGNYNEHTFAALDQIPSIKGVWFIKPPERLSSRFIHIPRTAAAEWPIFKPNVKFLRRVSEAGDLLALQFHPGYWNGGDFQIFKTIIHELSEKGLQFILPSSLLTKT